MYVRAFVSRKKRMILIPADSLTARFLANRDQFIPVNVDNEPDAFPEIFDAAVEVALADKTRKPITDAWADDEPDFSHCIKWHNPEYRPSSQAI